jgi:hypothetical protein
MSAPGFWTVVYDGGKEMRVFGTVEAKPGGVVEITQYDGGVGGFPRPKETIVMPLSRIIEWKSDR